MIDLYFWPTPNGLKPKLLLEETGLAYRQIPVDIGAGDQFKPAFLAISPNNRIPALVDNAPIDGGAPVSVFESGAVLLYLAEKTGRFLPADLRGRMQVLQWLFWQVGGLGPMAGQNGHFTTYAPTFRMRSIATRAKRTGCMACSTAGWRGASSLPATTPSPTWPAIHGSFRTHRTGRTWLNSPTCSAGSPRSPRAPRRNVRTRASSRPMRARAWR
jgi:hypothetical protein